MIDLSLRRTLRVLLSIACGLGLATPAATAADVDEQAALQELALVRSTLFGADMVLLDVDGHNAFILKPAHPKTDGLKPWVWYAPTLLADREQDWRSPGERHAWMFWRLLEGRFTWWESTWANPGAAPRAGPSTTSSTTSWWAVSGFRSRRAFFPSVAAG